MRLGSQKKGRSLRELWIWDGFVKLFALNQTGQALIPLLTSHFIWTPSSIQGQFIQKFSSENIQLPNERMSASILREVRAESRLHTTLFTMAFISLADLFYGICSMIKLYHKTYNKKYNARKENHWPKLTILENCLFFRDRQVYEVNLKTK